jgi:enamine deaminase RidA (YjgF/YER057c/UK114 family)
MVSVGPGFTQTTNVINGCSDLLLEVFGPEVGMHARTAIGVAALPLNLPVIIAAEVAVR